MAKASGNGNTRISLNGQEISVDPESVADEVHKAAQEQIQKAEEQEITIRGFWHLDAAVYRSLFALKQEAAKRKKAFARWN